MRRAASEEQQTESLWVREGDRDNKGNLLSVYYRARVQELLIPIYKKLGKNGKGLAQLSRDLLAKVKGKEQMCRQGNQGQAPWDEYRDAAWFCKDGVREA